MIEIDIWRTSGLMLRHYGDKAIDESAARAELAAQDDYSGQVVWHRITDAVSQLAYMTPPGALH